MSLKHPQAWLDRLMCLLTPVLLLLPYRNAGLLAFNYTGLLNSTHAFLTWVCLALVFLYDLKLFIQLQVNRRVLFLLCISTLLTMLCPYTVEGGFFSALHLLLCFFSFLILQFLLYSVLMRRVGLLPLYMAGLVPCLLTALTFLSINGLCEVLYGIVLLIVLRVSQ